MTRSILALACTTFVVLLVPSLASAAAPALQEPAAAATVTEGKTVTYSWTGDLLGADSAQDQSYFKVEVIAASDAPSGQQSIWDADNQSQTVPGEETTSVDMGAPPAGSWKWRVCAWGVVDPTVSVTVQQIPNGCSAARTLTSNSVIATDTDQVAVIDEQRHVTVASAPTIIEKTRPATTTTPAATPRHVTHTVTAPTAPIAEPVVPIKIEKSSPATVSSSGKRVSSLALSNASGIDGGDGGGGSGQTDKTSGGVGGVSGALANGLGASIPGLPIPFWVLLFVLACVPVAIVWRRSVLAMFEWSDGSIDGFGTPDARTAPMLAKIQPAQGAHAFGGAADDAAIASVSIAEPTGSRRAA